jgi:hypothetical protein
MECEGCDWETQLLVFLFHISYNGHVAQIEKQKVVQNFGGEACWKVATWKTEKEM